MSTDIVMGAAFDQAVNDLTRLIDRHFAANRTLTVEPEGDRWVVSIDDDTVLWRGYDRRLCAGFIRKFLEDNPNVRVSGMAELLTAGHSVRVPDNVVPIGGRGAA